MCDLHPNCSTVTMLERAGVTPSQEGQALPAGFLTLTEEEYGKIIRQCPIETYYDVSDVPISMGQWSSVFQCRLRSTGAQFVAKFCNKLRMGLEAHQEIVHEVSALRQCRRCPRIVQLYEVFETDDQYILVMEFGSGGDLQAILDDNQVPYESDVMRFMRNLLEGLVFIHERNLAHLDIKPQNLVLTGAFPDCDIKLCDLEISRVITADTEVREMLGTPDYVAPEILRFDPVCLTSDIWSVGVLAYVLLTGFTPFGGDTDSETFRNISNAELDFPEELFEDISELAKDFIRRCLVKDPKGRLSARQSLMHPWLQQPEAGAGTPSVHGSSQSIISDGFGSTDSVRTLRRSASKSREVLCEKVSNSNLKKNISKSRERLCDLKFGLSKSRERLARTVLAGGVSRSTEVLGGRPPWRAAGVNCPLGKPLPPPMERMGSFKVRDQYQSQVVAGMGSSQSLSGSAPFVRHCSLRGRKKQSPPQGDPPDFRSSLRRNKKNTSRRNSLQMDAEERPREPRRRSHSNRDEPEPYPRLERRRDSRRELSLPPDDGKNMIIVEIISDGEEEDVFTRLYRDRLRDSELKWRKLRDSDFERDDDEKENKAVHRTPEVPRRPQYERSRSRESHTTGGSKSGSDETLVDRLNTLSSPATARKSKAKISDMETHQEDEHCHPENESPPREASPPAPESADATDDDMPPEKEPQPQPPAAPTSPPENHISERYPSRPQQISLPRFDVKTSEPQDSAKRQEARMLRRLSNADKEPKPPTPTTPTPSSMRLSPDRVEPSSARPAETSWRRLASTSPNRWRRPASSSPEPGAEPRRRRPGTTLVTSPHPAATQAAASVERSVNTDSVATRDRGINTDSVLLADVVAPPQWERAEALGARGVVLPEPAPVATLRDVFEQQDADAAWYHEKPRQGSEPTETEPTTKSPTVEGMRRRSDPDEKRSVAFAEAAAPRKCSSAGYRRCSSLSSDLGSSEVSSDAGSESYCVVSWEEAPAPAGDQATELKPVLTSRPVGRPRSQSQQLAQLELARLRQRGRSSSVTGEPYSAAQPWGPLCSGSVARAVEKLHSMAGETKKRRQSSPSIVTFANKVSDIGDV